MSFLRSLWTDLVEKRLWPVALLLVVALVAAPIAIGRGSSAPVDTPVVPATPDSSGAAALPDATKVVALTTPGAPRAKLRGRAHDPFRDPTVRAAKGGTGADTATTATVAASPVGGGGASPEGGASPAGGTRATSPSPSPSGDRTDPAHSTTRVAGSVAPAPNPDDGADSPDVYRVALRFGRAGSQRTMRDVARLTLLPSVTNPLFVFLGVLDDGKTALFLVSSDATATGDGTCRPDPATCRTIALKAGDSERFDVTRGTGGVLEYELDVLNVEQREVSSQAVAVRAHRRESRAGRNLLRVAIDQRQPALQGLTYDARKGTLHADPAAALRAAGAAQGHRFPPLLPAG